MSGVCGRRLTANAAFDDDGDVALRVWFGLRRLFDGIDAYVERTAR